MDPGDKSGDHNSKRGNGSKKSGNKKKPLYEQFPKGDPKNPPALQKSISKSYKCKENRERKREEIQGYKKMILVQQQEIESLRQQNLEKDESTLKLENLVKVYKGIIKEVAPGWDISGFMESETVATILSPATVVMINEETPQFILTPNAAPGIVEPYHVLSGNALAAPFQHVNNLDCTKIDTALFQDGNNRKSENVPVANLSGDRETVPTSSSGNLEQQSKALSSFESEMMTFGFPAAKHYMDFDAVVGETLKSPCEHPVVPQFHDEGEISNSNPGNNLEEQSDVLSELGMDCLLDIDIPAIEDSEDMSGDLEDILRASLRNFPTFMESPYDQN